MRNAETMTITLTRLEVCDLLIACTMTSHISRGVSKWVKLHDEICEQLREWDNEYDKTHDEANAIYEELIRGL